MDDSAEYRHVKRRRYITVALSVALTTVLCVGYVVADIFDKLPGVFRAADGRWFADARLTRDFTG